MYKINEMFETIQGEGVFTGVPAVFVRLQICPVGCSWCDTKQTWEALPEDETSLGDIMVKTEDSPTWSSIDAQGIVNEYIKQGYTAKHIVITGGEPCIYDLVLLLKHLSNTVVAARLRPAEHQKSKQQLTLGLQCHQRWR